MATAKVGLTSEIGELREFSVAKACHNQLTMATVLLLLITHKQYHSTTSFLLGMSSALVKKGI